MGEDELVVLNYINPMKTPSKILIGILFISACSFTAFAGQGFEYWKNRSAADKATAVTPPNAANGMNCSTMLEPKVRASREISTSGVTACTPETLKTSARCQQACGS